MICCCKELKGILWFILILIDMFFKEVILLICICLNGFNYIVN